MNRSKQRIFAIILGSALLPTLLLSTEAHAAFNKSGILKTENYQAKGQFWRQVGVPFRITRSGNEKLYLLIESDSDAPNYTYNLTLKPNQSNIVQLSARANNFCLITFTPISPTEARFDITDGTKGGCGIDEIGDITFNPLGSN